MSRPHPARLRLLSFLANEPAAKFISFDRIFQARQLHVGDALEISSLTARGWAELEPRERGGVRITQTGRDAAGFMKIAVLHSLHGYRPTDAGNREQGGTGMHVEITERNPKIHACASEIVAAYVSNNRVPQFDLPKLIAVIAQSLRTLAAGQDPTAPFVIEKPTKTEIQRSVGRDGIVSFIDGKTYRTLRRHLGRHGHTPQSYRMRYGLPIGYPMVAPSYSERRIELSKQNSARQRELAAARKLQ